MNIRPLDAKALESFPRPRRNEVMASIAAEICDLVTGSPAGPAAPPPALPPADGTSGASVASGLVAPAAARADSRIPYLRLTQFDARTQRASDGSDAALLSAYRTDVVPLLGREYALDDLRRWLALDRDLSIRVLTGGAGRGKTRLALELVRDAAGEAGREFFAGGRDFSECRRESFLSSQGGQNQAKSPASAICNV
jgi:hypothetical protein